MADRTPERFGSCVPALARFLVSATIVEPADELSLLEEIDRRWPD